MGHPVKLDKNIQQSFQYPIELSPLLTEEASCDVGSDDNVAALLPSNFSFDFSGPF